MKGNLQLYDGGLRFRSATRDVVEEHVPAGEYSDYIGEASLRDSYLKAPFFKPIGYPGGVYRVGPLGRLNAASQCGTPKADSAFKEFHQRFGAVAHSAFLYHYARLIEIVHALEKIETLLDDTRILESHMRATAGVNALMRLNNPFDTLIPTLIASYQRQIELHQRLIDISGKFVAGPKEGVDYQALTAKVPEIRAEMDDARKEVFDAAALVFATMMDMKPDSQGHVSQLIITKADKTALQDELDIMLKNEPDKGDNDFYISAAMILRAGLQKNHKCADEPWD